MVSSVKVSSAESCALKVSRWSRWRDQHAERVGLPDFRPDERRDCAPASSRTGCKRAAIPEIAVFARRIEFTSGGFEQFCVRSASRAVADALLRASSIFSDELIQIAGCVLNFVEQQRDMPRVDSCLSLLVEFCKSKGGLCVWFFQLKLRPFKNPTLSVA